MTLYAWVHPIKISKCVDYCYMLYSYNNSLRRLLHLPKYNSASEMFVCLNIMSFNELLLTNTGIYNFISRLSLILLWWLLIQFISKINQLSGDGGEVFYTELCSVSFINSVSPDGWAVWDVVMSTRWWLLVDHCVLRNWDRILVRAVKGLISRAGMVSICPLLWQRDVKLEQTKHL